MPNYTLGNLQTDVNNRIAQETGTISANLITQYAHESLRSLRRKFDFPSAEVISQTQVMSGVYFYALPYTGFKEFIALRDNFKPNDRIFCRNVSEDVFWSQLQSGNLKSESRTGTSRRLLINFVNPATRRATLNSLTGVTTDGTWAGSEDAGSLATDTLFFREGSSSLSFTITPSANAATLTNSTFTQRDLSGAAYYLNAMFSLWIYIPTAALASGITGFRLRFGSSATVYWQISVTTQIDGSSLVTGWNQIGFDWQNATSSGSPVSTDAAALDYAQIRITFSGLSSAIAGVRLNDLKANQRRILNLHSTTDLLVIDGTTSASKEQFDSATDTSSYFNLDSSFTDFILYEVLEQVFTTHIANADARAHYQAKRMGLENDLIMRWPSKRQPEMQEYNIQARQDAWLRRGRGPGR